MPEQRLVSRQVQGAYPHAVLTEPQHANRFLWFDLSDAAKGKTREIDVTVRFQLSRETYRVLDGEGTAEPDSEDRLARFRSPDRLVPVDGRIREEAHRVAGGISEPRQRARRLYDRIVDTLR